jgi:hypothetical protein
MSYDDAMVYLRYRTSEFVEHEINSWLCDAEQAQHPKLVSAAKTCPFNGVYEVSSDGPYRFTSPGSIGHIYSYCEDGTVGLLVLWSPNPDCPVPVKVNVDTKYLLRIS